MKVFLYIYSLHTGGGAENVMCRLALYLRRRGWTVYACAMLDEEPSFETLLTGKGIKVIRLQSTPNPLVTVYRLVKVLREIQPDIMLNWLYPCIITGGIAGHLARVPRLIANLRGPDLKKRRGKVWLDRLVSRLYTGQIAVSQNVKAIFVRREKYRAEKITVINNGLDLSREEDLKKIDRRAVRRGLQLTGKNIVLGTVGRLYPEKNQQFLLRAFARLVPRLPEARLLLVGDGPARQELEHLAVELCIYDRVVFAGWQGDPYRWLKAMDFYILPSLYEGHSGSILQAWLCRLPVLGARVTGIRDLIIDGKNGLLFALHTPQELVNIILNLLAYPQFRRKLAAAGYQTVVENYAEEKMYAEYLNYLQRKV
ncbi:MAG: glycosyltransferase [Candidatus Margulisbacteria bacterium]|jgi:glycosyltransferase involved in cell wall biosynthesis|nr:glycosyltransferase [Candidatus Margulisiibacteriota bacterium]